MRAAAIHKNRKGNILTYVLQSVWIQDPFSLWPSIVPGKFFDSYAHKSLSWVDYLGWHVVTDDIKTDHHCYLCFVVAESLVTHDYVWLRTFPLIRHSSALKKTSWISKSVISILWPLVSFCQTNLWTNDLSYHLKWLPALHQEPLVLKSLLQHFAIQWNKLSTTSSSKAAQTLWGWSMFWRIHPKVYFLTLRPFHFGTNLKFCVGNGQIHRNLFNLLRFCSDDNLLWWITVESQFCFRFFMNLGKKIG